MKRFAIYVFTLSTILGLLALANATPNFNDGVEKGFPAPLTEEEYLEFNNQQRYGACYPYCKEANQLYVKELWHMLDEINMLREILSKTRIRLQECQADISMPPTKCEPCIELITPGLPPSP